MQFKKTNNLEIISKDKTEKWILPHLSKGKRGFSTKFDLVKIIQTIIKRLKTSCQWREISVKDYFGEEKISWQNVYYFFNKWSKDGSFRNIWVHLLNRNKKFLDMSAFNSTEARPGAEWVENQQGIKEGNLPKPAI